MLSKRFGRGKMKKKITSYLTKFVATMIVGMAVFVVMDLFEAKATPVKWIVLLIATSWLAYTSEFGEKDDKNSKRTN